MSITHIISLSDSTFFTIVTSALEAYKISQPGVPKNEHVPLETYGNLWGYQIQTKRNESLLHVALADSDISAVREPNRVTPVDEAFHLKRDFADHFFPELEYLGDFHSHPYHTNEIKTELELQRLKLHEESPADRRSAKFLQQDGRPYRLQIIASVFEREEAINRRPGHLKDDLSCIRFQYDMKTVWIKAYAYRLNAADNSSRRVDKDKIALICPHAGVTVATING